MTQAEVAKLVAVLMACYPGMRFPDGTVVAYETFLLDLDHARAKQAVAELVRSSKFMPTIAEIVTGYEALAPRPPRVLREWVPDRDHGQFMKPKELAAAIGDFLGSQKPPSGGAQ